MGLDGSRASGVRNRRCARRKEGPRIHTLIVFLPLNARLTSHTPTQAPVFFTAALYLSLSIAIQRRNAAGLLPLIKPRTLVISECWCEFVGHRGSQGSDGRGMSDSRVTGLSRPVCYACSAIWSSQGGRTSSGGRTEGRGKSRRLTTASSTLCRRPAPSASPRSARITVFVIIDVITTGLQVVGAAFIGVSESDKANNKVPFITTDAANDILLAGLAVQVGCLWRWGAWERASPQLLR